MSKSTLKQRAIELRGLGKSVKEIAGYVGVSTSTVSLWVRNVVLTADQKSELERRSRDPNFGKRAEYLSELKKRREVVYEDLHKSAKKEVGSLSIRDKFVFGLALYWAEGFKKDRMVGFSNTDPEMIKIILAWFKDFFQVRSDRVRLRVVINESHLDRYETIQSYWEGVTGFGSSSFYSPTLQRSISKKTYANRDTYFGVLRVRILKSTSDLRRILSLIKAWDNIL